MERWKTISGFPHYEVSTEGRVRSLPRMILRRDGQRQGISGGMLSPVVRNGGGVDYAEVTISNADEGIYHVIRKVHHLVLDAFVGSRPDGMVTRHLNGNSLDNRLGNVIYGTQEENVADRSRHGRTHRPRGENNGRAKLTADDVREIRQKISAGTRRSALAIKYNVSPSLINQIGRRVVWTDV